MARKDLLDQRRTRTRHADDEDGVWRHMPLPRARFPKWRGELGNNLIDLRSDALRIIMQLRTAQRIALGIMGKGGGMIRALFACLAQRKMQVKRILCHQSGRRQRNIHRRNIVVRKLVGF